MDEIKVTKLERIDNNSPNVKEREKVMEEILNSKEWKDYCTNLNQASRFLKKQKFNQLYYSEIKKRHIEFCE